MTEVALELPPSPYDPLIVGVDASRRHIVQQNSLRSYSYLDAGAIIEPPPRSYGTKLPTMAPLHCQAIRRVVAADTAPLETLKLGLTRSSG